MQRRFLIPAMPLVLAAGSTLPLPRSLRTRAAVAAPEPAGGSPLRVALVRGNLAQAAQGGTDGSFHGVSVDVADELGRSWGRQVKLSLLSPAAILDAVAGEEVDLGFVAPGPDRMGQVAYSQAYMLVQQSAIVPDDSSIRSAAALDGPGLRIGANAGDSVAGYLRRTLRHATVAESPDMTMGQALSWLRDGTVAAFTGNRQRLGAAIRGVYGLHLLPDNIYAVQQAIAVSPRRPDLLATVDVALGEMRRSGFLERAVRASGVDGIAVAPSSAAQPQVR